MANSHTEARTQNTLGGQYQVFLSFCGFDTRRGFANSVYYALLNAGIHVFIDEEELERGERISSNLPRAIDDSKIYVPIFSTNYASRHWCLRELAKMVENTTKSKEDGDNYSKKVIIPIFYNVTPDDVKLNTPVYSDAISSLEKMMMGQRKKFDASDTASWRQALKNVGGISGLELKNFTGDGHLSESIVEEVVRRLQTRHREMTEDLVGMEARIADINNLLDMETGDVRLIGICGMGGMGKTTLAENIFNQLCPRFGKNCSFLADVKETTKTKGLIKLREQLLSDVSYSRGARNIVDTNDGIKAIGETICGKKLLIVLDDVDDSNQIRNLIGAKSLYSGTRIIVTTRDKNVLNIRGFKYEIMTYEMEGLSDKDALQLFSRHAFDADSPPPDYFTLSEHIISTTGGLPLALKAIGASLFGQKEKKIWEEVLEELWKIPHDDVLSMLKITYDALNPGQKQIFLDIACLFMFRDKAYPIYMWKDCGFSPEYGVGVLINRCMIKVLDNNTFTMHDQFRDLGRAINNQERSRLRDRDDIIHELRSTEINTFVQTLDYDNGPLSAEGYLIPGWSWFNKHIPVTSEQIKRFPHLRLLRLHNITCQGDFTGCLSELRWIDLNYERQEFFTATNLNPENVVVMAISGDEWREDAVISLVEGARKLKALTLSDISSLHRTPTFSEDSVLEKLTFRRCGSLKEIDCSIWKLRWLTDLSLMGSDALRNLPKQIGKLKNLQHLSLWNCGRLRKLPDSVSELESLTELDVSWTGITRLPDSIDTLQSLSSLDLSYTCIVKLPETMSKLSQLRTLDLNCSGIQELPKLPGSLTTLLVRSSSLQTVPDLSNLTNLVELLLSDDSEILEESNIIQPCDLRWIGKLSKLRKLQLCLLNVHATSTDWCPLPLLEELALSGLDLQTLKQLPSNLRVLELNKIRVKQVELDGLSQLEKLTIQRCKPVKRLSIPSSLRELREATVDSCCKLVEVQFLSVLESMEILRFLNCKSLERLVCPSSSEEEEAGPSDGWRRGSLVSSSLKMLKKFSLWTCPELQEIQFVSKFESMEEIAVGDCISLKRVGGLSNLKNLNRLEMTQCESLQFVEGIDELERLENLRLTLCRSMGKIIDASSSKLPNECEILIWRCGELLESGSFTSIIPWKRYRRKILNAAAQASDSGPSKQKDDDDEDDYDEDDDDEDNGEDDDDDDDDSEDDEDEDDGDEGEDDDVHEALQSSHGSRPACSVGDNNADSDVNKEGEGESDSDEDRKRTKKKLKRRGFCSCLAGLHVFIPWIMTGNEEDEEESDDGEAEEEVRDGT